MLPALLASCLAVLPAQDAPLSPGQSEPTSTGPSATAPAASAAVQAAAPATAQTAVSLDGRWDLLLDPDNTGLKRGLQTGAGPAWSDPQRVAVPGVLEAHARAMGYDGVVWYRTRVPALAAPRPGEGRLLLAFDNANWRATVFLDGERLGEHDGGDAPFRFDVTGRLQAGAGLVVRCVDPGDKPVDGLVLAALPNARESWFYNFGGLVGSVRVEQVPLLEVVRHDAALLADGSAVLRVDVENHGESISGVELTASVNDGAVSASTRADLPPGATTLSLPLPGAETLERWSPATPVRHRLQLALHDGARTTTASRPLALRRFEVDGARFVLNGEVLPLRGVQYEASFPRTIALPPDGEFLRRELSAIRAAGFNLVRVVSRALPDLYALCDELGLLVQAEPTIGSITWETDATPAAVDAALVALAQAASGHPSVVMVNVLDEFSGDLSGHADALLLRARQLLPDHLILDASGGPAGSARFLNPGSDEAQDCEDVRLKVRWPWTAAEAGAVAALGQGHERLVYVSRWGCAGVPSFLENVAGFGDRLASDDARDYAAQLETATAQFGASAPLVDLARNVSHLGTLCQAAQARALQAVGSALRSNPRIAGDCCTVWRDVAWQDSAGLCNAWGEAKPALAALAAVNAGADRPAPPSPSAPPAPAPIELPTRPTDRVASGSLVGLLPEVQAIVAPLVSSAPELMTRLPRIAVVGSLAPLWTPGSVNLTVVMLRFVRDGGTLLLLDAPDAGRPFEQEFFGYDGLGQVADLPVDVTARRFRSGGQTWMLAAPRSGLFADIPGAPAVLDERFEAVLPDHVLQAGPRCETSVQLGAVDEQGLYVGAAVQAVRYGAGHLVLSTLRLGPEQLSDPLASRLLENLVRCAATIAAGKSPPSPPPGYAPPPELVGEIERQVWRHRIYFGLAERLAEQSFLGRRPLRDCPPELPTIVARKNAGLDAIVSGRAEEGSALLASIDRQPLEGGREQFLRNELLLSSALQARGSQEPGLGVAERRAVERMYQRALRLMRLGEASAAQDELRRATELLAPPATADTRPAEEPLPESAPEPSP